MEPAVTAYDNELRRCFGNAPLRPLNATELAELGATDLFAIVFSNRSGSTLLADTLYRRGLPIPPQVEVLDVDLIEQQLTHENINSFSDYLMSTVLGWRRHNLCGFKLGPQQLLWLREIGVLEAFRSVRLLRTYRSDVVAQAVSLCIARQTGAWHSGMGGDRRADELAYDGSAIAIALKDIRAMEALCDRAVAMLRLPPYRIEYEALREDRDAVVRGCCEFLGWEHPPDPDFVPEVPALRTQRSEVNTVFADRFRAEESEKT